MDPDGSATGPLRWGSPQPHLRLIRYASSRTLLPKPHSAVFSNFLATGIHTYFTAGGVAHLGCFRPCLGLLILGRSYLGQCFCQVLVTLCVLVSMTINDNMAALVGFACEAFFYGCYTILFAMSIYLKLNCPHRRCGVNRPIFIISVLLYLSCSTHFVLEFSHFYMVLNTTGVEEFSNETDPLTGAELLISVTDFMCELIFIYRCWVLWSKSYWIIFLPSLAAIASLAPTSLGPLGLAVFILPLCTNAIVTTLIVIRIWYLSPEKRRDMLGANFPTGVGLAAIVMVIESGMLYVAMQLVFVILFAIRHPAQAIIAGIVVQVYGIAPTLILIRISLGLPITPSGPIFSGAASVSRTVSTLCFSHSTPPTPPTDLSLPIATDLPISEIEWKPSGGDLISNFSSAENATKV